MKKLLYIIPALFALVSCDGFFQLDNMEGYNAQITGKFIDAADKSPILLESYDVNQTITWGDWSWTISGPQAGYMMVYEQGWDSEDAQNWFVKYDGTYTNNLVFAGKYRVDFSYIPVYPIEDNTFELKKGPNTKDFVAVPYARVKNFTMKYVDGVFVGECDVEPGDATKTPSMSEVKLMVYTDRYVNSGDNRASDYPGAAAQGEWSWATFSFSIPAGHKTLTIDPNAKDTKIQEEFKYAASTHFFRVAAQCGGNGINPNNLKNFSPIIKATPKLSGNQVTGYDFEEVSF